MAEACFVAGAVLFLGAGGAHALAALVDVGRPTFFPPVDDAARAAMGRTTFRFRRLWPGARGVHPSMWRLWLGFNLSHGLGAAAFGGLLLALALHDYDLVTGVGAVQPLAIAVSAAYFLIALRFWFYVPAAVTGAATACFALAALLA